MFLSFVVPIYNVKDYLRECIDSLLNQKVDDYEIILVDDGSTDGSGCICDEYIERCKRVRVIHQENRGQATARNIGIEMAKGEYIACIDGDDFIEKNCLKDIQNYIITNDSPDVLFLKAFKYDHKGNKKLLDEEFDEGRIVHQKREDVIQYIAELNKFPGSSCTKIVKKDLIVNKGMYFEDGKVANDLQWVKEILFKAESFGYYDKPYYYYRQNRNGSLTNVISSRNYYDRIELYDRWIDEVNSSKSAVERDALKKFLAYEYQIMILDYSKLDEADKECAFEWLKKNKYLIEYRDNRTNKMIDLMIRSIGIKKTSSLLCLYLKRRQ